VRTTAVARPREPFEVYLPEGRSDDLRVRFQRDSAPGLRTPAARPDPRTSTPRTEGVPMDVASDPKATLQRYVQVGRDALVWKLDGLSEYDVRRPVVRSGTNLLGIVKHLAGVEAGYLGEAFGRPFPEPMPWMAEDAEPNADLWATADESREDLLGLYRRVWAHADDTVAALDLVTTAEVPWWPEDRRHPTLHLVLVHVATEIHRHAGHADIVRELLDGAIGHRPGVDNLPAVDDGWWREHRERLEDVAREVAGSDAVETT
jgi:hypothetical protein